MNTSAAEQPPRHKSKPLSPMICYLSITLYIHTRCTSRIHTDTAHPPTQLQAGHCSCSCHPLLGLGSSTCNHRCRCLCCRCSTCNRRCRCRCSRQVSSRLTSGRVSCWRKLRAASSPSGPAGGAATPSAPCGEHSRKGRRTPHIHCTSADTWYLATRSNYHYMYALGQQHNMYVQMRVQICTRTRVPNFGISLLWMVEGLAGCTFCVDTHICYK